MPGISDRSSLRNAILDSLVIDSATNHRLSGRGVKDYKKASRLRIMESSQLSKSYPSGFDEISNLAWDAVRRKRAGNHYVYKFMLEVTSISEDRDLFKTCRDKGVLDAFDLQGQLMAAKLPMESGLLRIESLPEDYNKIHSKFIVLRSLYNAILTAYSKSGSLRGKLQSLNVKNNDDESFKKEFSETWERLDKGLKAKGCPSPLTSIVPVGKGLSVEMTRISDLIFMRINHCRHSFSVIATSNHLDRMTDFLIQYSNVLLGYTLAYSAEIKSLGVNVAQDVRGYIRELCKLGLRDDLSPGETGKAVTDLFKSKLSQTKELPWDNFKMLLKTYPSTRRLNAKDLWEVFGGYRYDPDIMLNISLVWKICPQPDSDIRKDFEELTEGLMAPNKISEDAAKHIELSFRRAFLIGILREKRQPHIVSLDGREIPDAVARACKLSRVNESDLREITFGMMEGLQVRVSDVFPNVSDTSHLSFKDKSSSNDSISLRRQIWYRESVQLKCENDYDLAIADNAVHSANNFLMRIRSDISDAVYEKSLRATTNDILSSIDEDLATIFREAEYKFKTIVSSLRKMADSYGSETYLESLREWAKNNPELLINTGTEPKLGEVHKRTVRIFYMFEKGMKTFLSQFERMSRLMDHYIKGAEIVKGDRAREKHMNILSSAHKSVNEGILSYQILFDLSKFSQKFNHRIIDAAAKVIGEACDYPDYQYISDIFKASFLYVSARNVDSSFVGVLGCFEGFLNFLWTGIHATVMDIALRGCGRSGDLAAYSDDGLLMFTMRSTINSPVSEIHAELEDTIGSIIETYKNYGLDFNLGKTIISRTLAEFLGVVQYKGKRLPTWTKELCKLGTSEGRKVINSLGGDISDVSAQMEAMIKAGMPPNAAAFLGYLELSLGPGRRLINETKYIIGKHNLRSRHYTHYLVPALFLSLNSSFGGNRVQDILTMMTTADHDPISEMLQDLRQLKVNFDEVGNLISSLPESIVASQDYTELLNGAVPLSTSIGKYGSNFVQKMIVGKLRNKFAIFQEHPLSKKRAAPLHDMVENTTNVAPYVLSSLTRYLATLVEYNKLAAPLKANSMARLLSKRDKRIVQKSDTNAFRSSLLMICEALRKGGEIDPNKVNADMLYSRSYPKVSFAPTIPSYRQISRWSTMRTPYSYRVNIKPIQRQDDKGSMRLLNSNYSDDLAPPLVTTDVNIQHISQAPDVVSHCTRAIYSEIISAASQGHDIVGIAEEILIMNGIYALPDNLLSAVHDLRKIAVANRKKHIHRVHWATPTKCSIVVTRLHGLNELMSVSSNVNYSLIVTVTIAQMHFLSSLLHLPTGGKVYYIDIDPNEAVKTKILRMITDRKYLMERVRPQYAIYDSDTRIGRIMRAISSESFRQIEQLRLEIQDNMVLGRMNMLADFKMMGQTNRIAEPLRYALVWSLISKLDNFAQSMAGSAGVTQMKTRSAKLDSIPTLLADYAMIYRTYRHFRKAQLAKVRDQDDLNKVIDKSVIAETIYIASELGVRHTLDVGSLGSMDSYNIYQSMLMAQDCEVVYYSLDSNSEDHHTDLVSHARARAIGRSLDVVITRMFKSRNNRVTDDLMRLTMMIIRGSVRGSVHRMEPFNRKVVVSWYRHMFEFGDYMISLLPPYLQNQKTDPEDDQWVDIPVNHIKNAYAETVIHFKGVARLGDVSQYEQACKYVSNLIKWGQFRLVEAEADKVLPSKQVDDVIRLYVNPILAFVRTVSYSTAESVLKSLPDDPEYMSSENDPLSERVNELIESIRVKSNFSHSELMGYPPNRHYRIDSGPLDNFTIRFSSPGLSEEHIMTSLIFSISLPLLIAAGKSGFKWIHDYKIGGGSMDRNLVENLVTSYSIPQSESDNSAPIFIIRGFSEFELLETLKNCQRNIKETSLIVVEIPPAATVCSLGVIAHLTSNYLSYITTSLSSDFMGFSIYVSAFIEPIDLQIRQRFVRSEPMHRSLGDAAMKSFLELILSKNPSYLSKILLTPLHQAGLPVNVSLRYNGEIIAVEAEEELIDKLSVSFIEAGKPSLPLMQLSKLPDERSAYIAKALIVRKMPIRSELKAIISASYYYHGMYPHLDPQELANLFTELLNAEVETEHIENAFRFILDPLVALQGVSPSEMSIGTQVYENKIPNLKVRPHYCDDNLNRHLEDMMNIMGSSLLMEEMENPILELFRNLEKIDSLNREEVLDELLEISKIKKKGRVWIDEEIEVNLQDYLPRSSRHAEQYLEEIRHQIELSSVINPEETVQPYMTDAVNLPSLMTELTSPDNLRLDNPEPETPLDRVYRLLGESGLDALDFDEILDSDKELAEKIMSMHDSDVADAVLEWHTKAAVKLQPRTGVI